MLRLETLDAAQYQQLLKRTEDDLEPYMDAVRPVVADVAERGDAALVDQNIVLTARMDLSAVNPGVYLLGVRRGEFRWAYYQVRVG